jgi:hypothetical protein
MQIKDVYLMKVNNQIEDFNQNGYVLVNPNKQSSIFNGIESESTFKKQWGVLEKDPYLDNANYRSRRYSEFTYTKDKITEVDSPDFLQTEEINSYNGGVVRKFSKIDTKEDSRPLKNLMDFYMDNFFSKEITHSKQCRVGVHQIRVSGEDSAGVKPAPEGVHSDGHDFVAIHVIERENVVGGESSVHAQSGLPIFKATLKQAWDGILINDKTLKHGVSDVMKINKSTSAFRDTLILDFNFEN